MTLPEEKQMEVLEAYDLTKSFRAAGQLCGVDHHTHRGPGGGRSSWEASSARSGWSPRRWPKRSRTRSSNGSTARYERKHHRVYRPWITEPGAWLQYDFGAGPTIDGCLHAIPDAPFTCVFRESRTVSWSSTVSYRGAR